MRFFSYAIGIKITLLIALWPICAGAQGEINIWYGNLNSLPVYAQPFERIYLDVWMQTDDDVLGATAAISVAMQNYYIDTTYNQSFGMLYPPLDTWSDAYFHDPTPDVPDPSNWTNQLFTGDAFPGRHFLNFSEPTRIMTMVYLAGGHTSDEPVYCFRSGYDPFQGPTAIGDTLGLLSYTIVEHFSPVQFGPDVSIEGQSDNSPDGFRLECNFPNPFNAQTTISYIVPRASSVTLDIYDALGRKLQTVVDGAQNAGEHSIIFNADGFSSGMYFYRLTTDDFAKCGKMTLLR